MPAIHFAAHALPGNGFEPGSILEFESAISCLRDQRVAYGVFDRMGFHIFDVEEADEATLTGMIRDIEDADGAARVRRETLQNARPAETDAPEDAPPA